jgi:HEPN domain-containing protein
MGEGPPLDEEEFRRWRSEADRALASAEREAAAGAHNWACFLAEQAAQLGLKGLLHGLGVGPWGHDLPRLGARVAEAGLEVPAEVQRVLARLGRHDIPPRSPDAHASGPPSEHYTEADSRQAAGDARAVLAFVDGAWEGLRG